MESEERGGILESLLSTTNISREDLLSLLQTDNFRFGLRTEILLIVLYTLIMTFGVLSNGIVCFIISRSRKLHTMHNYLIANLAVSDIIMSIFCMPFTLMKLLVREWPLGAAMCRWVPWIQAVSVFASTISITAIALDRHQTIMRPESPLVGEARHKVAFLVILAIWLLAALVALPLIVYTKLSFMWYFSPLMGYNTCLEVWPSDLGRIFYACVVMVLQFVVPILVIVIVHWRICTFLKERMLQVPAYERVAGSVLTRQQGLDRVVKEASRHRQNTTLLMAIAVIFALCWFPLSLLNFLADFNSTIFFQHFLIAFAFTHIIAMISACLNPILYGWFNSKFRREFKKITCFWRTSQKNSDTDERCHLVHPETRVVRSPGNMNCITAEGPTGDVAVSGKPTIVYRHPMCYKSIQTEVQPPAKMYNYGTYNEDAFVDGDFRSRTQAAAVDKQTPRKKRKRSHEVSRPRSLSDQTNLKVRWDIALPPIKPCKKHFLQ